MMKEENCEHRPIYYTNKVLQGAGVKYFAIEKFAYTIFVAARKMKSYF